MMEFESKLLHEKYRRYRHPSGLTILIFPKKMSSISAILSVEYGSMDNEAAFDTNGKPIRFPDGIAHFLEHKLFDNPDGSDSFARFSAFGADANAYTSVDSTCYLFNCTDRFEESLTELLTFVTTPYFTSETVKKEKNIICEEIRMYDDSPYDRGYQNLLRALYVSNPIRNPICGTVPTVKKITEEDLSRCYDIFYNLSNMYLCVVGNVTDGQVLSVADRVLPATERPLAFRKKIPCEQRAVYAPETEAVMQVSKPIFFIGIKDPLVVANPQERLKREVAAVLLKEVLFSASGAFYRDLFESDLISTGFGCSYTLSDSFGFFCISGESDDPQMVLRKCKEHLASVCKNGISDEDFERCRRVLYADEVRLFDSVEEIASHLLSFVPDGLSPFDYPELLKTVKKDDAVKILSEIQDEDLMAISLILPMEERKMKE